MMRSLRLQLILLLGLAILIATAVQTGTLFRAAMLQANRLFDYHMQQMALALQDSALQQTDLYPAPDDSQVQFEFVVQIWTDDGVRVYQSRQYRSLPARGSTGFSTVKLDNGEWRLYTSVASSRVIQVAQKVSVRRDRAVALAWASLQPLIIAAVFLLAATWWVVSWVLSPIERARQELATRDAGSLLPVDDRRIPEEIRPLVGELNSLLERMGHALQAQQRFVADAAHELRSPLTALKLQVQTVARAKSDIARDQAIQRLVGGIDRASRLVTQLLLLARENPSAREITRDTVWLPGVVAAVTADVAPLAAAKSITLDQQLDDDATVLGEEESLQILLRNLLDNAVRYTTERGSVRVIVKQTADVVVLTVEDSGPGIQPEHRQRVFDQFFRIPGTAASGSGLGLAIVKAIADRHEADISLHEAALGGLAVRVVFAVTPGTLDAEDESTPQESIA